MKTLVITEKKSVADDFSRVLGGFKAKGSLGYENDHMVIAWASGHLLELQDPSLYEKRWKHWSLGELPILPANFVRKPRDGYGKGTELLTHLVKQIARADVGKLVNACDAGREGELIFSLILEHAIEGKPDCGEKPVQRLWLQSMTANAIRNAFQELREAGDYAPLRDAAYARDEADWIVGMNGTRGFTRKFMGRAKSFFAVGRVKTPTLAFLVDREREIDNFRSVPYFQVDATFAVPGGTYIGRWSGPDEDGKKADRLKTRARADEIAARVQGRDGKATEKHTTRTEAAPLLYDLTTLQREASSRFGYTLDRTLSLVQSLYEQKKAVTYPRTSSRYLPTDYQAEIPRLAGALLEGEMAAIAARAVSEAGGLGGLKPIRRDRVFDDKKVSDHFALIPTGENPKNLRDDERRIFEMIVRRFFAVFLPLAHWDNVTRETVVEGESFITRDRRLSKPGWRCVDPVPDAKDLAALPADGVVGTTLVEVLDKETMPPARYTDGTLVKAMETASADLALPETEDSEKVLEDEQLEALKEKGIGTAATRAAIVKDLIMKQLARREPGRIVPTPLGCTLVRLVRNLKLGFLAQPELTGDWEYRLARMANGGYSRKEWDAAIREKTTEIVTALRDNPLKNEEVFAVDHPAGAVFPCPACKNPLVEKTFSWMCSTEGCEVNISKDQRGKYLFPETMALLLREKRAGPWTGFARTRAAGFLKLRDDHQVEVELLATVDEGDELLEQGDDPFESVPDGTEMGKCPRCASIVTRDGMGYRCAKNIPRKKDKECDFRLSEKIKYRYLPPAQIRKMLNGEKTDELFGFVSMRGKKFKASLFYKDGQLQWEFPPRKPRVAKAAKPGAKGARKRKTTANAPAAPAGDNTSPGVDAPPLAPDAANTPVAPAAPVAEKKPRARAPRKKPVADPEVP